jgi:hypothetical protein
MGWFLVAWRQKAARITQEFIVVSRIPQFHIDLIDKNPHVQYASSGTALDPVGSASA